MKYEKPKMTFKTNDEALEFLKKKKFSIEFETENSYDLVNDNGIDKKHYYLEKGKLYENYFGDLTFAQRYINPDQYNVEGEYYVECELGNGQILYVKYGEGNEIREFKRDGNRWFFKSLSLSVFESEDEVFEYLSELEYREIGRSGRVVNIAFEESYQLPLTIIRLLGDIYVLGSFNLFVSIEAAEIYIDKYASSKFGRCEYTVHETENGLYVVIPNYLGF